jgi:acyl-CoA thioester hydrolase
MTSFPARLTLRLDWSEMDLFGHINNVSYFKYLQAGRVEYWERTGMTRRMEQGFGPILAESTCRFVAPLAYPGTIEVRTGLAERRTSSFALMHQIYDEAGRLCAEGRDVIVWYDYGQNCKAPLGPDEIAALEQFEGNQGRV